MAKGDIKREEFYFLYITAASKEEAVKLARTLVAERLVACENVIDHIHTYNWWGGEVKDDFEAVVVAKTQGLRLEAAIDCAKDISSYECPCVVAWPLMACNSDFFRWITKETGVER